MVHELTELNDRNRLLIAKYQEYEDLEDEENSRSSCDCRRFTEQIERLEDLRL